MRVTPLFFGDEDGLRDHDSSVKRATKAEAVKGSYGHQIRVRRIACGISQERFGDLTGFDQTTISRIETGSLTPSDETRIRIEDALRALEE